MAMMIGGLMAVTVAAPTVKMNPKTPQVPTRNQLKVTHYSVRFLK